MGSTVLLRKYNELVEPADRLPRDDIARVLFGLFGEVGGIMTADKKHIREEDAFPGYRAAIEEEFGDALWYLAALCRRLGFRVEDIFGSVLNDEDHTMEVAATDLSGGPVAKVGFGKADLGVDITLLKLGDAAATLLKLKDSRQDAEAKLQSFAKMFVQSLQAVGVDFARIAHRNVNKVRGRFLTPDHAALLTFDGKFSEDEKIPSKFDISFVQRSNGKCYLKWNGVFIGDPLADNIEDRDGYRFHDVFHFSHAAILNWSPTFRALIKHKRKSDSKVDEEQDSGRAIVVEEGLTAWIFSRAKELNFFEGMRSLSFDLLKTVKQFVSGYEVDACPLALWERAILDGYVVFREVRKNNGGMVVADRVARTISFKPLSTEAA